MFVAILTLCIATPQIKLAFMKVSFEWMDRLEAPERWIISRPLKGVWPVARPQAKIQLCTILHVFDDDNVMIMIFAQIGLVKPQGQIL